MSTLRRAIKIAKRAHKGQVDKANEPYISHSLRIMSKMSTNEQKIVAILHDVIEDTNWTFSDLKNKNFSDRIIKALRHITKTNNETYEEYIIRCSLDVISTKVKMEDLKDNINLSRFSESITNHDIKRVKRYIRALEILTN